MAGFTENALIKKLQELNSSQQSIQTLSLWLIHHRKHHGAVVKTWFKEILKAKDSQQLTFMYLANDVIQNSKKKGPEYGQEFGKVLKKSFEHMAKTGVDEKTKSKLHRILNIWEERGVFDSTQIKEFKIAFDPNYKDDPTTRKRKSSTEDSGTGGGGGMEEKRSARLSEGSETALSLSPPGDPPESEELVKMLLELESSASSDAAVREQIASLPPEVSELQLLSKLQDRESALALSERVQAAVELLTEYNARLADELTKRRRVATALKDYAHAHRELAAQAETRLEEYNIKLQKMYAVRSEVRSHMENLPDVSQLPNVTGGLAPLPSAGDLFNSKHRK